MKKAIIEIVIDDQGRIGTKLTGGLSYTDVIGGCHIVIAQVIEKMGLTAKGRTGNPLIDARQVA